MVRRKTSKFFSLGEASKEVDDLLDLVAPKKDVSLKIQYMGYGPDSFEESKVESILTLSKKLVSHPVNWINVDSTEIQSCQQLADLFGIHELALEDAMKFHQRSKVDTYKDHLFIVLRIPTDFNESCDTEQVALFLGKNYVISFQEKEGGDCLEVVRERIRKGHATVRQRAADHLAYLIIDAGVDAYFPMMERMGDRIETLEDAIVTPEQEMPANQATARIHELKLEVLAVRRSVWPMRDTINLLCRDSNPFINDGTRVYLRDCYDHLSRIIDLVEMYRELATDLLNIYLSAVNNRMNEIIKVLTIITSLFIPPTFIAGIYGMNFNPEKSPFNMPELNWYFGYPLSLLLMVITSGAILVFLRKKGWM